MFFIYYMLLYFVLKGSSGRATGATAMNAQSSRSHCIFTLTISQMKEDGWVFVYLSLNLFIILVIHNLL